MISCARTLTILLATVLVASCESTQLPYWQHNRYSHLNRDELVRFDSHEELAEYFKQVYKIADDAGMWWAWSQSHPYEGLVAQADTEADCPPDDPECGAGELQEITVTGSSVKGPVPSITNNQEIGVDEGDIVKHYRNYLIVLQDGRLFSVDLGNGADDLEVADRIDVYKDPEKWTWYDELLISDDLLIVTGYSYSNDASEISIFRIDDSGIFEFLTTYLLQSSDYFAGSNYATRLVDGHLVIYTPLPMYEFELDEGIVFPLYRQIRSDGTETFWEPLFDATDVFWPLQTTLQPVVHTISVCPIEGAAEFRCESTGIVGPEYREFYVTPEYAYIWNALDLYEVEEYYGEYDDCDSSVLDTDFDPLRAVLYRIPLFGGETDAVHTAGIPHDQFSFDARDDAFHAVVAWDPGYCYLADVAPMRYARIDNDEFSAAPRMPRRIDYIELPPVSGYGIENRFTESHLVYSDDRVDRWDFTWQERERDEAYALSDLIVVPLDRPSRANRISLGHGVDRLEVLGNGFIAFGQYLFNGLHISTLMAEGNPRIADRQYLYQMFESEGRSHAFNFRLDGNLSGMFGIPTTVREPHNDHWHYRDRSDLSFFTFDPQLMMSDAGALQSTDEPEASNYECEVSCYDWYGNARPIFLYDRIFALSGTEIIEGQYDGGQIREIGRLSITNEPR